MSFIEKAELAVLEQNRRALRALLVTPKARANGLAKVEDLHIPGPAGQLRARYY